MKKHITEIISLSIIIESIITYFKEFFINWNPSIGMIFSIILGIIIAITYELDLPKYINLKSNIPYVGNILTGILISRGSNYIHDILRSIADIN